MILNKNISSTEIIRNLGVRFRDYRMRLNMTQQELSDMTAISIPTIYKFENGRMTDMSLTTLLKLMRAIGLPDNWMQLLPELPESPYMYREQKRKQRIRHKKNESTDN